MGQFSNVREREAEGERRTRLLDALNNLFWHWEKGVWTHWIFMSRPCSRPTWRSCSLATWKYYTNGVIHQTAFLLYDTEWAEERLEQDEQRNAWPVSCTSATINLKIRLLFMVRKKNNNSVTKGKNRGQEHLLSQVFANYKAWLSFCSELIFMTPMAKSIQIIKLNSVL